MTARRAHPPTVPGGSPADTRERRMTRMLWPVASGCGHAIGRAAVALLVCWPLQPTGPTFATDTFKRLTAAEIRARIIGNVVTDESHWSDRFEPGGIFIGIELGKVERGTWRLAGDQLCVKRQAGKPVTECFEIWLDQDEVEYRRDGVTVGAGVLRKD